MTDEHQLVQKARSILAHAERQVDVEGDLERLHHRLLLDSDAPTPMRLNTRRRYVVLAIAACVVALVGATAVLITRDADRRITPVTAPPSSSASSQTTVTSPPSSTSTEMPAFRAIEPSGGVVSIDPDTPLNAATFERQISVGLPPVRQVFRVTDSSFAAVNATTGTVDVFDLAGANLGSATVPNVRDEAALQSIAIGPELTVYALYGFDPVTVAAFTLTKPAREITSWQRGMCEASCFLAPTPTGFAVETGDVVPYVDAEGRVIDGPARPLDPTFSTTWTSDADDALGAPTKVEIIGPTGAPGWTIRLDRVAFNNELFAGFARQPDGSYTVRLQLEPVAGDRDSRIDVLLWLVEGGRVVAVDLSTVPGLADVVVTDDGGVVGLTSTGTGVAIGVIRPAAG